MKVLVAIFCIITQLSTVFGEQKVSNWGATVDGLRVSENKQWSYIELQNKSNDARIIFCGWKSEPANPNSLLWILNLLKLNEREWR